jgi:hypothetical protein
VGHVAVPLRPARIDAGGPVALHGPFSRGGVAA